MEVIVVDKLFLLDKKMSFIGWAEEHEYMSCFMPDAVREEGKLISGTPLGEGPFTDFELMDVTPCGLPLCREKKVGKNSIVMEHAHTCEKLFKKAKYLVVLTLPDGSKTQILSGSLFKQFFSLEEFKLAVISEEVSDLIVSLIFPDVFVENEQEISEMIAVMQKHRPVLLRKLDALTKK